MTYSIEVKETEVKEAAKKSAFVSLSSYCTDPELKSDAEFSDKLQSLFENPATSKFSSPFLSQFRYTNDKFRRSIKARLEIIKKQEKSTSIDLDQDAGVNIYLLVCLIGQAQFSNFSNLGKMTIGNGSSYKISVGKSFEVKLGSFKYLKNIYPCRMKRQLRLVFLIFYYHQSLKQI